MRAEIDPDPGPCEACRTQAPYRIPVVVECPNGTNKIMRLCSVCYSGRDPFEETEEGVDDGED